jgi:hypothetical protein
MTVVEGHSGIAFEKGRSDPQAENARWKKEKGRLDAALQRARG